jgi:hypothetical protein
LTDPNDRALQQAVIAGLAEIGLPSPESNAVLQIQRLGAAVVARVRFRNLWVQRASQKLFLTSECRYDDAEGASRSSIWDWARYVVPADALVLAFHETRRLGLGWPSGWPRPPEHPVAAGGVVHA